MFRPVLQVCKARVSALECYEKAFLLFAGKKSRGKKEIIPVLMKEKPVHLSLNAKQLIAKCLGLFLNEESKLS